MKRRPLNAHALDSRRVNIARREVRVVTPALFIATKLEAFHGRGSDDVVGSHDLEDIIAVVDRRPEIVTDVAAVIKTSNHRIFCVF